MQLKMFALFLPEHSDWNDYGFLLPWKVYPPDWLLDTFLCLLRSFSKNIKGLMCKSLFS